MEGYMVSQNLNLTDFGAAKMRALAYFNGILTNLIFAYFIVRYGQYLLIVIVLDYGYTSVHHHITIHHELRPWVMTLILGATLYLGRDSDQDGYVRRLDHTQGAAMLINVIQAIYILIFETRGDTTKNRISYVLAYVLLAIISINLTG